MTTNFRGSLVAIVTPFASSGAVDREAFERLIDRHLSEGSDGVVVAGTTGESPTLEEGEWEVLIRLARERLDGRIPLVVGSGTNDTRRSIARTRRAAELGADAALVVTPYYNKPTQEGLHAHFRAVAEASPIPLILYNVPGRTACDLLPETAARLAEHPRVVGLKEATAGTERLRALRERIDRKDFRLLSGDDATACDFLLAGGHGVVSVTANVAPRAMHDLCAAACAGDAATARALDERLAELHRLLFVEPNPVPVKWALHELGLIEPVLRLPLLPLSPAERPRLHEALVRAGLLSPPRPS
jgi:4-hydroxy-tetrahydrodipicolinate synthase